MERVKIVQYGVTHEHAPRIKSLRKLTDYYEVVGVVDDRETSRAARWPQRVDMSLYEGLPRFTPEEVFQVPGLQAVSVEVTNDELVPVARQCLEHGLPTLMDKPGGQTLEPFVDLTRGFEAQNIPFQMGYMFRCNPAIQFILEFVRKGLLGTVFSVEADMNHNYGDASYQAYLGTFKGGIMYNLCCHHLDYIVTMLGRPDRVTHFPSTVPGTAGQPENSSLAVLEYGACRVILRASSWETHYTRVLKITGTNGLLELRPVERFDGQPLLLNVSLREAAGDFPAGNHTLNFGVQTDRFRGQFVEFARIIRGEIPNPQSYEHDRLVQEVLLDICR